MTVDLDNRLYRMYDKIENVEFIAREMPVVIDERLIEMDYGQYEVIHNY